MARLSASCLIVVVVAAVGWLGWQLGYYYGMNQTADACVGLIHSTFR